MKWMQKKQNQHSQRSDETHDYNNGSPSRYEDIQGKYTYVPKEIVYLD